jgi:hypothetical protein
MKTLPAGAMAKKELHVSSIANEPGVKEGQFLISPEEWQLQMS